MVVAEQSKAVKRQYVELVGHYVPTSNPKVIKFDKDRVNYWISKGAKPSETVASLLKAEGMPNMDQYIKFQTNRKSRAKKAGPEPVAEAPKADAPAAEAAPQA